jgi:hypothetical protein
VKKPSGGSTTVSGPYLTPKQKAERDRAEAANAREEAAKAREEAKKAGEDARRDEQRAAADRRRHEYKDARQEMREARSDLAREHRDLARAGRDQARAGRDMARARTAGLARPGGGGAWILGGNDRYATCAAAALANSLLMATGRRVADEDVLALHAAAAGHPDTPASVLSVLETASQIQAFGVNLEFGEAQFKVACILELALPGGGHAAVLGDGFAVSWGTEVPLTPAFLDRHLITAWAVTWAGPDPVIT